MYGNSGTRQATRAPLPWLLPVLLAVTCAPAAAPAEDAPLPDYRADRGSGLPTSLFGTYVRPGEWLVYPFYEYERVSREEYHPSELGFIGDTDYLGRKTQHEFDLFLAYGLGERVVLELEGQLYTRATLDKARDDPSALPARLRESGLGEIESQVRWRWADEGARRPEFFSFFELVFPFQRSKVLIGASDWAGALGFGAIKGTRFGTFTGRVSLAYEDRGLKEGEFALEYLRRLSPRWRAVLALEGAGEDLSAIGEAQYLLSPHAILKLNCGLGLTRKVPDLAPELGVMLRY